MRSKNRFGFTLMEGLFSLFLVAFVMAALANTLRQTAEMKRNTKNLDQEIEGFHLMLMMENDVNSALELLEPRQGQSGGVVRVKRVDPGMSYFDRTDIEGEAEDPYEASEMVIVEYGLEEGFLYRKVEKEGNFVASSRISRVDSFEAALGMEPDQILTLKTMVDRERAKKEYSLEIALRVQR